MRREVTVPASRPFENCRLKRFLFGPNNTGGEWPPHHHNEYNIFDTQTTARAQRTSFPGRFTVTEEPRIIRRLAHLNLPDRWPPANNPSRQIPMFAVLSTSLYARSVGRGRHDYNAVLAKIITTENASRVRWTAVLRYGSIWTGVKRTNSITVCTL